MVSIFFDLVKTYDMTWRHGILQDMHSARLIGILPIYIRKFLKDRKFKVRIGSCLSESKPQANRVPQGSLL